MEKKQDIYAIVTEKIIEGLNKGIVAWQRPWINVYDGDSIFVSHVTGRGYSFLNEMLIAVQGGKIGEYLSLNQANKEGGKIKKGEHPCMITFWTEVQKRKYKTDPDTGEKVLDPKTGKPIIELVTYPMLKIYHVFHVDQCIGIKTKHPHKEIKKGFSHNPIKAAEAIKLAYFKKENMQLKEDKIPKAYYSPGGDYIHVPELKCFKSVEEYYSTIFHEMTHSTGATHRLNRDLTGKFGSRNYAREELTAEIGASFLIHLTGINTQKVFNNTVAYLQGWAQHLKKDPLMITFAATKAEAASKYILAAYTPGKRHMLAHTRHTTRKSRQINTHVHKAGEQLSLF